MPRERTPEEIAQIRAQLEHNLAILASHVKLMTGVGNNCALAVMVHAYNEIAGIGYDSKGNERQPHPNFRHQCKKAYQDAIRAWHDYEAQLLYARVNRFFHLADLSPETRKIYGSDVTDQQFFEFWKGIGAHAFDVSKPLIYSLHNKYRLSLQHHGIKHAELTAWPMVATACLALAVKMYNLAIDKSEDGPYKVPKYISEPIFRQFSLQKVLDRWKKALDLTDPFADYELDELEDRNIYLGIEQLHDAWTDPDLLFDSAVDVIPDFDELFRTKGEMKKALRNISEVREETHAGLDGD